jgi:chromosome segregation ATPase
MNILDRLTSPASAEALAEIDTLKAEVTARESEVSELSNKVSLAEAALQEAATEAVEIRNKLATAEGEIETLKAEVARIFDLEAEAKLTAERVSIEASRQLAAFGHPAPIEGIEDREAQNTITRAQFNALSQRKRTEYIRNGGKLTD